MELMATLKAEMRVCTMEYLMELRKQAIFGSALSAEGQALLPKVEIPPQLLLFPIVEFASKRRDLFDNYCEHSEVIANSDSVDVEGCKRMLDGTQESAKSTTKKMFNLFVLFAVYHAKEFCLYAVDELMAEPSCTDEMRVQFNDTFATVL